MYHSILNNDFYMKQSETCVVVVALFYAVQVFSFFDIF